MTQKELAKRLGVTPATVSKAIKGAQDVSPATRARILSEMENVGMHVESERRTTGRAVLVITPEFASEYYATLLSSIVRALAERDLVMLTMSIEHDARKSMHSIERFLRRTTGICGVMSLDYTVTSDFGSIPHVAYGAQSGHVQSDYYQPIRRSVEHLMQRGCRRIAFVGDTLTGVKQGDFVKAAKHFGVFAGERYVHVSRWRFEQAGADGFQTLFALEEKPDAIFCAYDYIALGVLNSAEAASINVPRELAVIGSDNVHAAGAYRLGLSTIGINHRAIADAMVELLLYRLDHPDGPMQTIVIPAELYLRGTS